METKRKKYDLTFNLTVVKFAEQNSGEAAARHFSVDPKRVREWRKNKAELQRLSEEDDKRARLRGGGRKKASEELEVSVCEWIHSMRAKHLRVSRKMIRAKEVYATVSDSRDEESFTASADANMTITCKYMITEISLRDLLISGLHRMSLCQGIGTETVFYRCRCTKMNLKRLINEYQSIA
uniref:Brinker DNA-binding domain-containing protein n=1 Tax=Cyprinus carpio TaxID=7962 RepID=A0A8C1S3M4_CYPCA